VIFLRNMSEVTESKDALADENEGVSANGQTSVLGADDAMAQPSTNDETEVKTSPNPQLSKQG
jgi:hypothetical protein